jgi:hypothetical protein
MLMRTPFYIMCCLYNDPFFEKKNSKLNSSFMHSKATIDQKTKINSAQQLIVYATHIQLHKFPLHGLGDGICRQHV